jgi:hypothetical protein
VRPFELLVTQHESGEYEMTSEDPAVLAYGSDRNPNAALGQFLNMLIERFDFARKNSDNLAGPILKEWVALQSLIVHGA